PAAIPIQSGARNSGPRSALRCATRPSRDCCPGAWMLQEFGRGCQTDWNKAQCRRYSTGACRSPERCWPISPKLLARVEVRVLAARGFPASPHKDEVTRLPLCRERWRAAGIGDGPRQIKSFDVAQMIGVLRLRVIRQPKRTGTILAKKRLAPACRQNKPSHSGAGQQRLQKRPRRL